MQTTNSDYVQQLETVIISKLLPAYISHCERTGAIPDLTDLPHSIVRRAKAKEKLPLLLQPFKKIV